MKTPLIRQVFKTKFFELQEDFVFLRPNFERITIPSRFKTDFASIPKIFRPIFSTSDWYSTPAIIHDYLFITDINRSSIIFKESLKMYKPDDSKKTKITIWIFYHGVFLYSLYRKWKNNLH